MAAADLKLSLCRRLRQQMALLHAQGLHYCNMAWPEKGICRDGRRAQRPKAISGGGAEQHSAQRQQIGVDPRLKMGRVAREAGRGRCRCGACSKI